MTPRVYGADTGEPKALRTVGREHLNSRAICPIYFSSAKQTRRILSGCSTLIISSFTLTLSCIRPDDRRDGLRWMPLETSETPAPVKLPRSIGVEAQPERNLVIGRQGTIFRLADAKLMIDGRCPSRYNVGRFRMSCFAVASCASDGSMSVG
jgi:hypothetical protein